MRDELDEIITRVEITILSGQKSAPIYTAGVRMALCGPKYLQGIIYYCDGSCCGLNVAGPNAAPPVRRIVDRDLIIEGPDA